MRNTRGGRWPVALVVVLLGVSVCFGATGRLDPGVADSLAALSDDPLEQADLYSDSWQPQKAIDVLDASGGEDAETLWRLARSRIDKGENLGEDQEDAALRLYEQAKAEAEQAVAMDSSNALAHQTLAIACGRVALFKGVFASIGLVKQVRESCLNAIAKSDSIPIALYVYGRTHKKLIEKSAFVRVPMGLGWAKEDSVEYYFDRALEVSGGNMIQCKVEYADFLLEEKRDKDKARQFLIEVQEMPLRDEQDYKAVELARELIREHFGD